MPSVEIVNLLEDFADAEGGPAISSLPAFLSMRAHLLKEVLGLCACILRFLRKIWSRTYTIDKAFWVAEGNSVCGTVPVWAVFAEATKCFGGLLTFCAEVWWRRRFLKFQSIR